MREDLEGGRQRTLLTNYGNEDMGKVFSSSEVSNLREKPNCAKHSHVFGIIDMHLDNCFLFW